MDEFQYKVFDFFVHGEPSRNLCRLCFSESDKYHHLNDEICINSEFFNGFLTIFNLMEIITNYTVAMDSASDTVCKKCLNDLLRAYFTLKRCLHSEKKWLECYKQFEKNLEFNQEEYLKGEMNEVVICTKTDDEDDPMPDNHVPKVVTLKGKPVVKEQESIRCECCNLYMPHCKRLKRALTSLTQQCEKCNGIYKNKRSFKRHLKLYCGEGRPLAPKDYSKYFGCYVCNRRYKRKDSLYKHQKSLCLKDDPNFKKKKKSEQEKLVYVCEYCGLRLLTARGYNEHIIPCSVKHTNDDDIEKFICDMCAAVFYIKRSLIHHWRNTHVEKTIPCHVCGKLFKTANRVQCHMITHTKERNFKCDVCENVFVTKHALRYHIRLHTGEKPYFCTMCSERFISASRRMAHMRRVHLAPTISCDMCDSKFSTNSELAKHKKKHEKVTDVVDGVIKIEEFELQEIVIQD